MHPNIFLCEQLAPPHEFSQRGNVIRGRFFLVAADAALSSMYFSLSNGQVLMFALTITLLEGFVLPEFSQWKKLASLNICSQVHICVWLQLNLILTFRPLVFWDLITSICSSSPIVRSFQTVLLLFCLPCLVRTYMTECMCVRHMIGLENCIFRLCAAVTNIQPFWCHTHGSWKCSCMNWIVLSANLLIYGIVWTVN